MRQSYVQREHSDPPVALTARVHVFTVFVSVALWWVGAHALRRQNVKRASTDPGAIRSMPHP